MKISSRTILAAALLTALPMGSALACTISNWNGANTAVAANAGGPAEGIARYSGACGLSVDSNQVVIDNSPSGESTYRARFYVLTKAVGGTTTIFKATSADDGNGDPVITVDYTGSAFNFAQNDTAAGSVSGIVANRWYSIEVAYTAGGTFTADVAGNQTFTGSITPVAAAGNRTVGSAVLGVSDGTATEIGFDAFVSTRGDSAIGRLCRGDVNGNGTINNGDRVALTNELIEASVATGQPDCNEDGIINPGDRVCLTNLIIAEAECP